ncbi:spore germination protein [Paenibacillus sinopodophylli]|uniref:spore germination protein n=1 Tax=Paenibacillus sinopodophylli TaxID=1837342 RepID=UPI001FE71396|nr:spore germination protein [Paenibacillus sinopodophylli]
MTRNNNEPIDKQLFLDEHTLRSWFAASNDVIVNTQIYGEPPASVQGIFIYCTGMTDTKSINDIIMPELSELYEQTRFLRREEMQRKAKLHWHSHDFNHQLLDRKTLASYVFEGHLIFCVPSLQSLWTINIENFPSREPSESTGEISVRGPKDGFVEHLASNVALIRRRLRTDMLACQYYVIGSRTLTRTALLYIEDIADAEMIAHINHKLTSIRMDNLVTIGQLEEILDPALFTLFPTNDYTSRPDFAAECLLNGRFIILVDGNPTCIIAPVNLFLLMKSPEDEYFPTISANMGRILRIIGLLTTIFLPGFYISLSAFHTDQLPFPLLATISSGRHGLPMESSLEMFLIMCLMELFREAGVRLPSSIGQTLTVVGGLIIGDAAIRAGMISPLMIVVTATTVVAGSTLVNQVLSSTTILLRFASFFMASILGMHGFILSIILFVIYLTTIQSYGVPYLAPAAPLNLKQLAVSLLKLPLRFNKRRPSYLHTQKPRKDGNES